MNATHPQGALSIQLSHLGLLPGPQGTQRATGQVPGALGSDRPAAPGAGRVGAQPHLRLGFPPPGLWTELAGPHRLLGSLCLTNGARDAWGTERRNAQRLWPGTAAAPSPHWPSRHQPQGTRASWGQDQKVGTLPGGPFSPAPACIFRIPQIAKGFPLYPQLTCTCPKSSPAAEWSRLPPLPSSLHKASASTQKSRGAVRHGTAPAPAQGTG